MEKRFLSGNALKMIAAASMLLDHMGVMLFPNVLLLRILGRLAFPIYAFMIAEGCRYTKNKLRYFLPVFVLGGACQIVYYLFSGDDSLNILLTFSASILLIYALQASYETQGWREALWSVVFAAGVIAAVGLDMHLSVDYGFWGIMTPVFVAFAHLRKFPHWAAVLLLGIALVLMDATLGAIKYFALLSLPVLLLYSGRRGKGKLKYFFYIFYPAHLVLLEGIYRLI